MLDNGRHQLSAAIRWAARELVQGSAVVEKEATWILNTDYEDLDVPAAFGSTNHSLANTMRHELLKTGEAATQWAQLLSPET